MGYPDYVYQNFVAVSGFEALYKTSQSSQTVIFELRVFRDENLTLFTILDGQEIRETSIHSFVINQAECVSLQIEHPIRILWNGQPEKAALIEEFIRAPLDKSTPIHIRVGLKIGENFFQSDECDTLSDAIKELKEFIGDNTILRLQTCFECIFGWPAFRGPGWDDRNSWRCYRDVPPETFKEVLNKLKFASHEVFFSGHYFVNAFHTCAAWRPQDTSLIGG